MLVVPKEGVMWLLKVFWVVARLLLVDLKVKKGKIWKDVLVGARVLLCDC